MGDEQILSLIDKMTLEEKADFCSGKDFWHFQNVERLGIPSIMVSNGPHGLGKQEMSEDSLVQNESVKSVCFPSGCLSASSFDRQIMLKPGETLGEECQKENVGNIKRSSLCVRNFEY